MAALPLPYLGPTPSRFTDIVGYANSSTLMSKDIEGPAMYAQADAAVADRSAVAAQFRAQLPSYVTRTAMQNELNSYYAYSDGGKPMGFLPLPGAIVEAKYLRNIPASRWEGPYWPADIPYNSTPVLATQPNGVAAPYKLCEFVVPKLSTGEPSKLLVFGRFEGYATDGTARKGRPEVTVVADGKVVAWGAAPNGNGTGQMWPIIVMPAVQTLSSTPEAATNVDLTVTAWLSTSFDNTSVGMGGMSQLLAYRVPM